MSVPVSLSTEIGVNERGRNRERIEAKPGISEEFRGIDDKRGIGERGDRLAEPRWLSSRIALLTRLGMTEHDFPFHVRHPIFGESAVGIVLQLLAEIVGERRVCDLDYKFDSVARDRSIEIRWRSSRVPHDNVRQWFKAAAEGDGYFLIDFSVEASPGDDRFKRFRQRGLYRCMWYVPRTHFDDHPPPQLHAEIAESARPHEFLKLRVGERAWVSVEAPS